MAAPNVGPLVSLGRKFARKSWEIPKADRTGPRWRSPWLRHSSLIIMTTVLGAIIGGLAILYYVSKTEDGLPLKIKSHFSWTYGPTAILTLVVAFWRQIDVACKVLTPWDELRQGNAEPERSVLLDYVSPLQAVSLYEAIKARHGVVVVTISGFVILKLLTLASTGLLFSGPISLPATEQNFIKSTQLDGRLYDPSSNPGLFDPSLAYTAYAVMANGLRYLEGTTEELVYEKAKLPSGDTIGNTTLNARVNALIPNFSCESAPVSINLQPANVTDFHPEDTIKLLFPECTLRNGGDGTPVYALNPQNFVCPGRQLSPLLQQIDCVDQTAAGEDQYWQLLTLADYRYKQTFVNSTGLILGDSNVAASTWSTAVEQVTGVACRSSFTIEEIELTYDFSQDPPFIRIGRIPQTQNMKLNNFTGFDLGVLTTSALMAGAGMFGNLIDNQAAFEYPNTLFKMMGRVSNGTYENLLDESTMIRAAEQVLNQVAIQSVSKYLVRSDNLTLPGALVRIEERLQVNEFALIVMLSATSLLVLLTFALFFIRPRPLCKNDPMPASNTALVLGHSSEVKPLLDASKEGNNDLHDSLKGCTFGLVPGKSHDQIKVSIPAEDVASSIHERMAKNNAIQPQQWWGQLTLQRWVLLLTLALPAVALVILEVLQQNSDRHDGIAALSAQASNISIAIYTRFIPALTMLLIATLVNALDFNILLLAPFDVLRAEGGVRPSRSILVSFLGLPAPFTLWKSFNLRHWGVFFSTTAALLASILTIIVSGLYTVQNVAISQTVSLGRADQFNTTWTNSVKNDSSAAILSSLTESLGLDYPAFTFGEYAFPVLITNMSSNAQNVSDARLQIRVPSLRSDLECLQLSAEMMNISASFNGRINTASASVFARAPLPAQCHFGGEGGNLTDIEFTTTFTLRGNASFVGKLLDLHVGPFDSLLASSSGELAPNTQLDNPPGCPSLAFVYGYANAEVQSQTSITAFMCYQYIDELQTDLTTTWPSLNILTSHPPVPDEASIKRLPSSPKGETAFSFRLQLHMDDEFSSFNQSADNTSTTAGSSPPLDNFFQGAVFGKDALDPSLLRSTDEKDVALVYGAIRGLYRRYMAQAISGNMRVAASQTVAGESEDADALPALSGTVFAAQLERRVVQNGTAKIILQVQLGAILILSSLAMYLTTLRNILPHNPCCIAGVAALFARSRMCNLNGVVGQEIIADGKKGLKDDRWSFRLGWWDDRGPVTAAGPGRWYGIDVQEENRMDEGDDVVSDDEQFPAWV